MANMLYDMGLKRAPAGHLLRGITVCVTRTQKNTGVLCVYANPDTRQNFTHMLTHNIKITGFPASLPSHLDIIILTNSS